MKISKELCDRLAKILGGTGMSDGKSCSIMVERKLNAKILGRDYETEHEINSITKKWNYLEYWRNYVITIRSATLY